MTDARTRATRSLFDGWASTYDDTVRESFGQMSCITFDDYLARVAEALAPAPGARLLEVAVGTAALAITMVRRWASSVHVVGVDANPHMLDRARNNVAMAGLNSSISLREADAADLPFADAFFDGVITSNALHHMDVGAVLTSMARVLRPGGRLVVGDFLEPPRWRSLLGRLVVPPFRFSMRFSSDPARRADGGYATILPWERWEEMLADRGFAVEHHVDFPAEGSPQWEPVPFIVAARRTGAAG
ncbi:MAG: methyltransferase domain-containing protein [Deltaproteobacteria bacterium]|nr:methyltransferase domain-containing protein [Deltaproteobacteria bacterium]